MAAVNNAENKKALNILFVQNDEGSVLPTGTPVYIKGNSNGTILIGKADSNSVSKMPAVGITVSRVEINQDVDIVLGGFLEVPIAGLTAAQPGQNLYVAGGGGLTTVEPSGEVQSLGKILKTNAANTIALESLIAFGGASAGGGGGVSEFIALDDTPAAYDAANRGYLVAHNSSDDGVEFIDPATVGTTTFTGLSDTPNSYGVGTRGFLVAQNNADSAVEFIDPTSLNSSFTFTGLSDTPANYSGATAGQVAAVNGTTDGVEFIDAPSPVGIDLALVTRDAAFSATGHHEGTTLSIGTAALTTGTVYMWGPTDWGTANAGAVATADGLMGVATTNTAGGDVLVSGIIQLASVPGSAGDVLYLNTSAGTLTATAPTGSGEIVRVMGYNLDGSRIYFNPSTDWLEIV